MKIEDVAAALNQEALTSASADIAQINKDYKAAANSHGKRLATVVVDAKLMIDQLILKLNEGEQAALLSRFDVKPGPKGTSTYSPFIACCFGEYVAGKTFKDMDGIERQAWKRNKSYAIYFHTMEELNDPKYAGYSREDLIKVVADKGAQVMANDRKKLINKGSEADRAARDEAARQLYLEDGAQGAIVIDPALMKVSEKAEKFVTVLVERVDDEFVFRGIASERGVSALTKLANDQRATLEAAAIARKANEEANEKVISIRVAQRERELRAELEAEFRGEKQA